MARCVWLLLLAVLSGAAWAEPKSCEALKREIEVKIQAAGVISYTLEIVPAAEVRDPNMVVGSCEGGRMRIIYQKNG